MPEFVFAEISRIKFSAKGRKETARNNWLIPRVVQNDKSSGVIVIAKNKHYT